MNVWADHVSTYNSDIDHAPKPEKQQRAEHLLVSAKSDQDEHLFNKMVQFEWPLLLNAVQQKHRAVFWTDNPLERLEKGLHNNGLAFVPHYSAIGVCSFVDGPFAKRSADLMSASSASQKSTWNCARFASACKTSCA